MKKITNKKWTKNRNDILISAVEKYGTNKWHKIGSLINISAKECQEKFNQIICKDFTKEEVIELLKLYKIFKGQYNLIASIMGKHASACYNMINKVCLKTNSEDESDKECNLVTEQIMLKLAKERLGNNTTRKKIKKNIY